MVDEGGGTKQSRKSLGLDSKYTEALTLVLRGWVQGS